MYFYENEIAQFGSVIYSSFLFDNCFTKSGFNRPIYFFDILEITKIISAIMITTIITPLQTPALKMPSTAAQPLISWLAINKEQMI